MDLNQENIRYVQPVIFTVKQFAISHAEDIEVYIMNQNLSKENSYYKYMYNGLILKKYFMQATAVIVKPL